MIGYTGTNFNRPAFSKMIQDIENRLVNLVIVKDYSRLARNYAWAGIYIDEIFPKHNVRFISINDNIDTFDKNNIGNDMSGFMGVVYDKYSADISKKIRTSFDVKRKRGQFIGAFAPYGYIKDPMDNNKFIVDVEVSYIVKRIFNMYVNGISMQKIMKTLNDENIPSPTKYKETKGNYKNVNVKHYIWRAETIKSILTNPTYIGHMTQRRAERISYKIRKNKKISKKDWIIVENTHEPIVDKETFELVQNLLSKKSYGESVKKVEHYLSGLLVCGDCSYNITFRRNEKKEFITLCSNYSRFHKCTRHAILEKELEELVIKDLKYISKKAIKDKDKFLNKLQKPIQKQENNNMDKIISRKINRLDEIKKIRTSLYEDKVKGIIKEAEFIEMSANYNMELETLHSVIANLQKERNIINETKSNYDYYHLLEQVLEFEIIDKSILIQLINKIEIFGDKKVKIHYNFTKP